MKHLVKIVLPVTIILFSVITKWWYAFPVDAPDTMLYGFPLPFFCEGWHTSLSLQIFVTEFFADFAVYFFTVLLLFVFIDRFVINIKIHRVIFICLWVVSVLFIVFWSLFATNPDNLFFVKRQFDIDVKQTGVELIWKNTERPDAYKFIAPANKESNK